MSEIIHIEPIKQNLKELIKLKVEISANLCYQCGKCSAGCPLIEEMDIAPNQIIRMIQFGIPELDKKILSCLSIWLCLTCQTCYTRCPKEVDLPLIMDFLRAESIKRNLIHPKAHNIIAFHKAFLSSIKNNGRLYELGLLLNYKLRTMNLLQDLNLAPAMITKGKLNFVPKKIKQNKAIEKIFQNIENEEEQL